LNKAESGVTLKRPTATTGEIAMPTHSSGSDPKKGLQANFDKVHDRLDKIDIRLGTIETTMATKLDIQKILDRLPPKP
jgi:hypothetical protein